MAITIEISKPEVKAAIDKFNKLSKKMNNMSQYWEQYARPLIIEEVKEVFNTEGYGDWVPRKDRDNKRPLLIGTRRLYNSWTKPGADDNINKVGPKTFEWGTRVPYAKYHEYEGRTPKRSIVEPITKNPRKLRRRLNQSLAKYLFKNL